MATHQMEHGNGNSSVYMLIVTLFIYLISVFSVQEWAAIAAIFAGVTTGILNLFKWWKISRKKKDDPDLN